MFRRPAQRLISAFLHGKHAVGSGLWQRGQRDAQYDALNLSAWARHPGIAGCMTKMLTGHQCADGVAVTAQLVRDALRTLRGRFRFVGIVERWELSVCLYHRILGHRPVGAEFFAPTAPGTGRAGGAIDGDGRGGGGGGGGGSAAAAAAAEAPGGGRSGRRPGRQGRRVRRLPTGCAREGLGRTRASGRLLHEQLAEVAQPA